MSFLRIVTFAAIGAALLAPIDVFSKSMSYGAEKQLAKSSKKVSLDIRKDCKRKKTRKGFERDDGRILYQTDMVAEMLEFRVKESEDCANPDRYPYRFLGNKIRKYNRTMYSYSTVVIFPDGLDDELKLTGRLAVFGNGGWKNNFFVLSVGGFCNFFRTYAAGFWKDLKAKLGHDCPVPPGNYTVEDLPTVFFVNWPATGRNTYKITIEGNRMNKLVFCKIFLVDIVARRTRT